MREICGKLKGEKNMSKNEALSTCQFCGGEVKAANTKEKADNWISVKERLPEEDRELEGMSIPVLFATLAMEHPVSGRYCFDKKAFKFGKYGFIGDYWQPLPELPKVVK